MTQWAGDSLLKQSISKLAVPTLASIQWLGFMFANTVVIPLSVGGAFHLSPGAVAGAMARSFLLTGIACLLQAFFGHKLPLMEGQSGMWWSVILSLTNVGASAGLSLTEIGGSISMGMVIGGALLVLCGLLGLHKLLNRLFTPVVMAVLLFLLAAQLLDIFFRGMVGLSGSSTIRPATALLSCAVAVLVSVLTVASRGIVSNFSILIGLTAGWLANTWLIHPAVPLLRPNASEIGEWFAWGGPSFHLGILTACILTALINTTNTVATLRAAEPVFSVSVRDAQYKRSLVLSGLFTTASGPLSMVAYAPYTSSIGFLRTTRILEKTPYVLGALLFALFGCIPSLCGFFATLPMNIGDAVLFVAYLQLFGSALSNLEALQFDFRTIFRVAGPVLLGLAIQSTPPGAFSSLPGFAQTIAGNGMLVGILLSVLLEAVVPWDKIGASR